MKNKEKAQDPRIDKEVPTNVEDPEVNSKNIVTVVSNDVPLFNIKAEYNLIAYNPTSKDKNSIYQLNTLYGRILTADFLMLLIPYLDIKSLISLLVTCRAIKGRYSYYMKYFPFSIKVITGYPVALQNKRAVEQLLQQTVFDYLRLIQLAKQLKLMLSKNSKRVYFDPIIILSITIIIALEYYKPGEFDAIFAVGSFVAILTCASTINDLWRYCQTKDKFIKLLGHFHRNIKLLKDYLSLIEFPIEASKTMDINKSSGYRYIQKTLLEYTFTSVALEDLRDGFQYSYPGLYLDNFIAVARYENPDDNDFLTCMINRFVMLDEDDFEPNYNKIKDTLPDITNDKWLKIKSEPRRASSDSNESKLGYIPTSNMR